MTGPLCIDLFCGLGGWTEGFLAEGWTVIGFDNERHVYGEHRYPAQLVLQDVRTIHGSQFRDAAMIVASSPCQAYSYMAMPWTKAKDKAKWYRDPEHPERLVELNDLFSQPARIQREACEAAGRHIPMIQENVRGAQPWVGRAKFNYGSYYLWGDVPPLMPFTGRRVMKRGVAHRANGETNFHGSGARAVSEGVKVPGMASWYPPGHPKHLPGLGFNTHAARATNNGSAGVKHSAPGPRTNGKGSAWFGTGPAASGSKSSARKAASARIAKIPFPLARHLAQVFYPREATP